MKESIFKKNEKKSFAFVEDQNTQNNINELDEFVNSGRGQTKKVLNPKGRPKVDKDDLKQEQIVIYLTKEQKEILEIWDGLDEKEREIFMTFIRSLKK